MTASGQCDSLRPLGTDLEYVVEHRSGVFVQGLRLARLEDDQPCPGVGDVGAVPPPESVLLTGNLQSQGCPADPGLPCQQSRLNLGARILVLSLN